MKRCLDVLCALCLLLFALPTLLLCALVIKLDSRGPILFRQVRMGRHFCPFCMLKLRTMEHRSQGPLYTLGADPRVTAVGRWMRRYKLDELPQLWNVLRGEMSIVGPRPVIPELTHEFHRDYERLLSVRPGLTDPAALKYRNESDLLASVPDPLHHFKTVVTPDNLSLSADYLELATIWSDLTIMIRTAQALMFLPAPHVWAAKPLPLKHRWSSLLRPMNL